MSKFAIYSTDISPTTDPGSASPPPSLLIQLDQDPIFGEYDQMAGNIGRGSVHPTLGGVIVQDFGVVNGDNRIRISERDALSQSTINSLKSAHETVNGEYYFTDGYNVWKVRFARPNGFRYWRNMLWQAHGQTVYSYEINFIVLSEEI